MKASVFTLVLLSALVTTVAQVPEPGPEPGPEPQPEPGPEPGPEPVPVCEDTPGWTDNSGYGCEIWEPSCAPDSEMMVGDYPDSEDDCLRLAAAGYNILGGACTAGSVLLEYEPGEYWWYSMTDSSKTWLSTDVPGNCQKTCERCPESVPTTGPEPGPEPQPEPGPEPGLEPQPEPGPEPGPAPDCTYDNPNYVDSYGFACGSWQSDHACKKDRTRCEMNDAMLLICYGYVSQAHCDDGSFPAEDAYGATCAASVGGLYQEGYWSAEEADEIRRNCPATCGSCDDKTNEDGHHHANAVVECSVAALAAPCDFKILVAAAGQALSTGNNEPITVQYCACQGVLQQYAGIVEAGVTATCDGNP